MQFSHFFPFLLISALLCNAQIAHAQEDQKTIQEYESRKYVIGIAQKAEDQYREMERDLKAAKVKTAFYKNDLKKKQKNPITRKETIKKIKAEIKVAEAQESLVLKKTKLAKLWVKETLKMIELPIKKRNKLLTKYALLKEEPVESQPIVYESENKMITIASASEAVKDTAKKKIIAKEHLLVREKREERIEKKTNKPISVANNTATTTEQKRENHPAIKINPKASPPIKAATKVDVLPYDSKTNTFLFPPKAECQYYFNGIDEFTGKKRKDLEAQVLFYYTDERLRPYLKRKDYLTCSAYLSSLEGGYNYITLEISIASKNAKEEYGGISKGSIFSILTLEGTTVKLQANKSDQGVYNSLQEKYVYKGQYPVSGSVKKKLATEAIDRIRISWDRGYEEYEVYEVDFFIDQFACLSKKR